MMSKFEHVRGGGEGGGVGPCTEGCRARALFRTPELTQLKIFPSHYFVGGR